MVVANIVHILHRSLSYRAVGSQRRPVPTVIDPFGLEVLGLCGEPTLPVA